MNLVLLPEPRTCVTHEGRYQLDDTQRAWMTRALSRSYCPHTRIEMDPSRVSHHQGYRLAVTPEAICMVAASEIGLFYAHMTLDK